MTPLQELGWNSQNILNAFEYSKQIYSLNVGIFCVCHSDIEKVRLSKEHWTVDWRLPYEEYIILVVLPKVRSMVFSTFKWMKYNSI